MLLQLDSDRAAAALSHTPDKFQRILGFPAWRSLDLGSGSLDRRQEDVIGAGTKACRKIAFWYIASTCALCYKSAIGAHCKMHCQLLSWLSFEQLILR